MKTKMALELIPESDGSSGVATAATVNTGNWASGPQRGCVMFYIMSIIFTYSE